MSEVRLFQGDCIDQLKGIEDSSIHAVISDIPYGISFSEWDIKHQTKIQLY